jgi:hypothetical protein
MAESKRQLLSIGVFFIIIVLGLLLVAVNVIGWTLVFPLILVFCGCWALVLAGIQNSQPQKYERGTFSTLIMGLLLIALGGAWYLVAQNYVLYALALFLLVIGGIAIAAALKRK